MPKVHLLVNPQREDAVESALATAKWLSEHSVAFAFDAESATVLEQPSVRIELLGDCDLVVTFGGDGTLIRGAAYCSERATPMLGVFFGRFGFVTECEPHEVKSAIRQFLDGESEIDARLMLKGELVRKGKVVATLHALNEVAVQRAISTRAVVFGVNVDWEEIASYPADGLLVATPTGSTAYSLSAGGPIVDPRVQAMVLTPITPHSLGARPLVLSPDSRVELTMKVQGDAIMSGDGQWRLNMLMGDAVVVTRSERVTRLVQVDRVDFLTKLRTRLMWGARS